MLLPDVPPLGTYVHTADPITDIQSYFDLPTCDQTWVIVQTRNKPVLNTRSVYCEHDGMELPERAEKKISGRSGFYFSFVDNR